MKTLALIWVCFVARGLFYCSFQPLWEGYDEWSHFAVIERLATHGGWLVDRDAPVSVEIAETVTNERNPRMYEALQPPLYYWIASAALGHGSLIEKVHRLRIVSLLLGSLTVPLVFFAALHVIGNRATALATAVLLALLPEFLIDLCRVGNECLGVLLFSLLILLVLIRPRQGIAIGFVLGLGLLTKAYFLTALPAIALLYFRHSRKEAAKIFGTAFLISGWWYIHNFLTNGTLTGLNESVMLRTVKWPDLLAGAGRVHWLSAVDSILLSHIWFGAWSGLTVRSWIYHAFYVIIAVAVFEVARVAVRHRRYDALLLFYGMFWLGQLYNVLLLFLAKGASTSMGWYLYAVVLPEVVLLAVGLRRWGLLAVTVCCAALDVYTVNFVSLPFYSGLIGRRPDGSLENFHFHSLKEYRRGAGELDDLRGRNRRTHRAFRMAGIGQKDANRNTMSLMEVKLGDITVNRLGFGAMRITGTGVWGDPENPEEARRVLKRAVELGVNFIDTADSYGPNVSEQLIGETLAPYKPGVVIATKGGLTRQAPNKWAPVGRPEYLRQQLEMSLRRLKLERLELYQLHRIDPKVPVEETLGEIKKFQEEGKIRHFGLSEVSVAEIEQARKIIDVVSVQNKYNLTDRAHEDVVKYCEQHSIVFIPWFPVAAGELARPGGKLDQVASRHGATVAQLSIGWLLHHSPVILPIPGTSSVAHLEENMAAAQVQLTPDEWSALES